MAGAKTTCMQQVQYDAHVRTELGKRCRPSADGETAAVDVRKLKVGQPADLLWRKGPHNTVLALPVTISRVTDDGDVVVTERNAKNGDLDTLLQRAEVQRYLLPK